MVVKLNHKPIVVRDEDSEEKDFSPVYFAVCCIGYLLIFWVLDYCCFIFLGVHPFPFIKLIGSILAWF
jgi:hypothetical protein